MNVGDCSLHKFVPCNSPTPMGAKMGSIGYLGQNIIELLRPEWDAVWCNGKHFSLQSYRKLASVQFF